jgi:hypothetical protein
MLQSYSFSGREVFTQLIEVFGGRLAELWCFLFWRMPFAWRERETGNDEERKGRREGGREKYLSFSFDET